MFPLTQLLLIAILYSAHIAECAVAGLRTKTGRVLTSDDLQRYFPSRSLSDISSRLFEVTPSGRLIGESIDIDLRKVAGSARPVEVPRHASLVIDGVTTRPNSGGARLRKGPRFIVAENANGDVLAIWGPHIVLRPVNTRAHPGLFFTSVHDAAVNLHDDIATWNTSEYPRAADAHDYPALNAVTMPCEASGAPGRNVEVAIAFDSDFCASHGGSASDAEAAIRTLVAAASEPFSASSCLKLVASHIDAYCDKANDPYMSLKGLDAAKILEGFRSMWTSDKTDLSRDVAYFISGFEDGTMTAGRAYVGAACSNMVGFGWAEGDSPFILAHELGHSLGADHDSEGLMSAMLGPGIEMKFSGASMDSIMKFVDDPSRASCIAESGKQTSETNDKTMRSQSPRPSKSSEPSTLPTSSSSAMPSMEPSPSSSVMPSMEPLPSSSVMPSMEPSPSPEASLPLMSMSGAASPMLSPTQLDPDLPMPSMMPDSTESAMPSMSMSIPPVEETNSPKRVPSPSKTAPTTKMRPTPDSMSGTCYANSGPDAMFGCTDFSSIGHVVTMTGSAHVRIRQMASQFDIRLNVVNESRAMVRLSEIHVRLTADRKNLETAVIRRVTLANEGSYEATVSVPAIEVPAPPMEDSCCNLPLYIYTAVSIRRTMDMGSYSTSHVESVGGGFFETKVVCENVCAKRRGSAVLSVDGCPMCEDS